MVENKKQRGVSIAPSTMIAESVAEWPLHRVVERLRKEDKDNKDREQDCRVYSRSSIRFLNTVIDEVSSEFDVTRGRMTRWLSYHGFMMFREDKCITDLKASYVRLRRQSLMSDDPDMAAIINSLNAYTPADSGEEKSSYRIYAWVQADAEELAQICGMFVGRVVQLAIIRSALTCDIPSITLANNRLRAESERWDKWMRFRAGQMDVAVAIWGSL